MDVSLSVVLHRATADLTRHQPPGLGTWSEYFMSEASMWFTKCIGNRKPVRHHVEPSPAAHTDAAPREKAQAATQTSKPRMPQHAAASFLKTSTSRAMREANDVI